MAENINENNGKYSFVSKRELAWHKKGQIVDSMTSKEALELSGLDFEVMKVPLFFPDNSKNLSPKESFDYSHVRRATIEEDSFINPLNTVKGSYATIRTDSYNQLGVVGDRYEIIQNIEAFDFFDRIVGDGHAMYETAGALGNGETIFVTAKIPSKMIVKKDEIDKYLLFTNSHDGSSAIKILFTPIRVVCNNTLTAAIKGAPNAYTIRHTISANSKIRLAEIALGIVSHQSEVLEDIFNMWSKVYLKDSEIDALIKDAFNIKEEGKELSTRSQNLIDDVMDYHESGVGQEYIRGTSWGVFNAISGYHQNVKNYKDDDRMFKSIYQSTALNSVQKTFENLIAL